VAASAASFTAVQAVIGKHCTACHAATPTHESFDEAPGGVRLDEPALIVQYAPRILEQSVKSDVMPLGNETGMTDEERALIGKWIEEGAKR
jgi:uncharacterized membrane protein